MDDRTECYERGLRLRPEPVGLHLPVQSPPVERSTAAAVAAAGASPGVEASGLFSSLLKLGMNALPF
ncbi:hypothetical protein [Streptomyces sp. NPDC049585]|uniref:hypothetical protein n=1 Tax=Streptomyces sp. NPDC049585 TaxID=3155154 RepID=UPI003439BD43